MGQLFLARESPYAVEYVAANMRERDRQEIFALRWDEDPKQVANDVLMIASGFSWVAVSTKTKRPAAVIGATPAWPNVWSVFAFGTDDWPDVAVTLTRHVRRFMIPAIKNHGAHRAFCHSIETHTDAHRWLEYLGAKPEARFPGYGKNRENFISYVWGTEPCA